MSLQNQMLVSVPPEASMNKDIIDSHKNNINNIIPQKINNSTQNFKIFEINIFSQAKDMLDIRQVLEYYGLSVNSSGFVLCPFHGENTASFKVYDNSFYCFGCGESGTVIDFVIKYFGLTNIEAVKKLNDDFRLNLSIGGSDGAAICRPSRDNKNLVESFSEWERRAYGILSRRFREIHERSKIILSPDDPRLHEHVAELAEQVFVEWLLDMMIANMREFERQVEFYRDYGKAVARYEL